MSSRLHNWGGNFQFSTQNIQYPRTTADVQKVVRGARKLRVMGSRHSFNHIADSCDTILSTLGMNTIVRYNASVPSVTVQPGITYSDLGPARHGCGPTVFWSGPVRIHPWSGPESRHFYLLP
jgi:xylitol oxidase